MNDSIIDIFEKELKNKIALKLVPNQNEDQILVKYFKYFDLEGTGLASLRDFIKTVEKIGVVLGKVQDNQEVFNYYDVDNTGFIDYKKFAHNLFSKTGEGKVTVKRDYSNANTNSNEQSNKKKEQYLEKLHSILKPNGGKGLIQFCKEFKIVDYNNSNRINIDDFIKIINDTKIPLNINEIQLLFNSYDVYNNSFFYYEEMFRDMKNLYHNDKRGRFVELFYNKLQDKLGRVVKLTDLKRLFNPRNHPFFSDGVSEDELSLEFFDLVDSFQFISRLPRSDANVTKELFLEFFKYFGFGIDKDETFFDLVMAIFDMEVNGNKASSPSKQIKKKAAENEMKNSHSNPALNLTSAANPLLDKLRLSLKAFSRKSVFSLIKHFKYYDNGTKLINKYDFAKVMRDFRLNLTATDVEKLCEAYCSDKKQMLINYEQFVKLLCERTMNDYKRSLLGRVYEALKGFALQGRAIELKTLTAAYSAKGHPKGKDEDETFKEFNECLDLFHYDYKNKKTSDVPYEEFEEFYTIVSILFEEDDQFEMLLRSEWSKLSINFSNYEKSDKVDKFDKFDKVEKINQFEPKKPESRTQTPVVNYSTQDRRTATPNRPVTPLSRMTHDEKELALAQNQYVKTKTATNEKKTQDSVEKLKIKLRKRGIRGLMNLHKQFLLSCSNVSAISYGDFVKVLKLQRIDFTKEELDNIFEKFNANQLLNFSVFIRYFKKVLPDSRLSYVEKAFANLDVERSEMLFVDDIKMKFDASRHPDVVKKIRSEDDVIVEFLDCFELNYNFLSTTDNDGESNLVSFEEFANFYEYVSFLYDSDEDFKNVLVSTWKI